MKIEILFIPIAILITMIVPPKSAWAMDYNLHYRASSEFYRENNGIFFQDTGRHLHQAAIDIDLEKKGFRSAISVIKQWQDNFDEEGDNVILSEFFLDTTVLDWDITLGKKRLNWGVGFAHQPLNIITTESKLATGVVVEEGAWLLSAERFTDAGSLTFITADSRTQQDNNNPQPQGGGFRYYSLVNDWDLQGLVYFDDIHDASVGGSAVIVLGDALTWHVTSLWSKKYDEPVHVLDVNNPLPVSEPIRWQQGRNGIQFLTGINVSFSSGVSVILEYWYDERSANQREWKNLIGAGRIQSLYEDADFLRVAEREFFTTKNLMQHNAMLYFSYDSEKWDFRSDVQISPEDKGLITTTRILREWRSAHNAQLGLRFYGGSADSVYRQLPNDREIFLRFEGTF